MALTTIVNLALCALIAGGGTGIFLFMRSVHSDLMRIDESFDRIVTRTDSEDDPEHLDEEGNIHISRASHVRNTEIYVGETLCEDADAFKAALKAQYADGMTILLQDDYADNAAFAEAEGWLTDAAYTYRVETLE